MSPKNSERSKIPNGALSVFLRPQTYVFLNCSENPKSLCFYSSGNSETSSTLKDSRARSAFYRSHTYKNLSGFKKHSQQRSDFSKDFLKCSYIKTLIVSCKLPSSLINSLPPPKPYPLLFNPSLTNSLPYLKNSHPQSRTITYSEIPPLLASLSLTPTSRTISLTLS